MDGMDYSSALGLHSNTQAPISDAIAKARQIAAKIAPPSNGSPAESGAMKRPFDDMSDSQPDAKKIAAVNDPIGAQLRAIADQQSDAGRSNASMAAAAAAAAAASQINAKLGLAGQLQQNAPPQLPPMGGGVMSSEQIGVPDRMVGLVIGKGGEQIAAIQTESSCKVQFASDSGGLADRPCTLSGTPAAIQAAKDLIQNIINNGGAFPPGHSEHGNQTMIDIMIPGAKVGFIIGKGGETIKQLQERAGVKIVMIQDSNQPTSSEKPLQITGDPARCQRAREMIMDLLTEKDMQGYGGRNDYGSRQTTEIPVPRNLVGVVIGKGGEMIKKIQAETGVRVQFKPDEGDSPERMCTITGDADKASAATNMIHELVQNALQGDSRGGRGPPRDGSFGNNPRFNNYKDDTTFCVPSEKCGLVIGKGGETIRDINHQSGAYVELSRQPADNPQDRMFRIDGNPDQVQHAIQMICEKAGLPQPPPQPMNGGGAAPGGGMPQQDPYGQYRPNQPASGGPQQGYAPQGWGNAYQQWNQANPADPNKQAADSNAAAWAQYYSQFYNQQQQPQQMQQQPQAAPQQQPATPAQSNYPQPSVNPQTGQLDYSAAWAEYYRQQAQQQQAPH